CPCSLPTTPTRFHSASYAPLYLARRADPSAALLLPTCSNTLQLVAPTRMAARSSRQSASAPPPSRVRPPRPRPLSDVRLTRHQSAKDEPAQPDQTDRPRTTLAPLPLAVLLAYRSGLAGLPVAADRPRRPPH